jgi:co-chaperonin GroES (HSP10)
MLRTVLEPANKYVIVADMPRDTTIDGISMPDNVRQQEMIFGVVMFVGPEATNTKPKDRVCYGPYAGKGIVLDGNEFRLLLEGQIEAYLREVE